jgi:hypothetical protein
MKYIILKAVLQLIGDLVIIAFFLGLAIFFEHWWIIIFSMAFIKSVREGWND